jgi:hypothetical protein
LGKIKLSANMESNGIVASTLFGSDISTNDEWSEVLVPACGGPDDEATSGEIWWKVRK